MPYSLHEKSGLVSVPVDIDSILSFDKSLAKINNIRFDIPFLKRDSIPQGDALRLFTEAFDFTYSPNSPATHSFKQIDVPETAIPESFFPPCINNIFKGLEDGRKRALFILINFLRSTGWDLESIEKKIYEWNESNPEPLREQYLKSQLAQIKKGKQILPPPSCSNTGYYKALQVCSPDNFCPKIRNPSQYAKNKEALDASGKKKSKKKKPSTNK